MNDNEPTSVNTFFKDITALNNWIEKIGDKHDETLNITFTGELIKYTKTSNKTQRKDYGTGCDSFHILPYLHMVEYEGSLYYITEENDFFRKCSEFLYEKDFSQQYRDFIEKSQRNKNRMTSAKIQPFCKKCNFNLGVYDPKQKRFLPLSIKERRTCLYIHKRLFCVIWKTVKATSTDAIKELENNFDYEPNQFSDDISKQVVEKKSPISNEKDCLFAVFSLDLETVNVPYQDFCEAYAVGCYQLNRLKEC